MLTPQSNTAKPSSLGGVAFKLNLLVKRITLKPPLAGNCDGWGESVPSVSALRYMDLRC